MHNKILLTAAAAAAITLTLAGCSTAQSGTDSNGKTTITYAHWGNNEENATIKAMIAKFEKANPNITVNATWIQNNYEQQLQTQIAGGKAPTVSQISNTSLAGFKNSYQPVDVTASDYYSDNIPNSMKVDGKYYAVPFVAKTKVTAVNTKLLNEAGVSMPSKTDPMSAEEYIDAAKKLTKGDGQSKQYGSAPLWYQGWLGVNGGGIFNTAGTKCTVDSDAAVTAANQVISAQSSDGFAPTLLDAQGQDMFDWLSIGRIAMQPDFGPWNIAQLTALKNADDYAIIPDPGKGEPIEIDGLGISKTANAAETDAAKKFTSFMSTDTAAQERLTTSESSLGVPVVKSAIASFEAAAPNQNLKAFVTAVSQSTIPTSIKQYNQLTTDFNTSLSDQTAIGSGKSDPSSVLPKLQETCQSALTSGSN